MCCLLAYQALLGPFGQVQQLPNFLLQLLLNLLGMPVRERAVGQMLLAVGQNDDALAEIEKESDAFFRAYALARTYIVLGRRADADAALAVVEKKFSAEQPYNIAGLHALRGDRDQAFSWMERAYQQHDSIIIGMPPITVDPDMKNLHGDPRWEAFLRKMKLP
jgi:serine/threonine-protein kinase